MKSLDNAPSKPRAILLVSLFFGLAPASAAAQVAVAAVASPLDVAAEASASAVQARLYRSIETMPGIRLIRPEEPFHPDEEAVADARRLLDRGRAEYDRLRAGDAAQSLNAAIKLVPFCKSTEALYIDALELLAAAQILDGKAQLGRQTFERLLGIKPDYQASTLPTAVQTVFVQAEQSRRGTRVSVEFKSTPPFSAVYVDGRFVGVTPLSLDVVPGQRTVRFEKFGYSPILTNAGFQEGSLVSARLKELPNRTSLQGLARSAGLEAVRGAEPAMKAKGLGQRLEVDAVVLVAVSQSRGTRTLVGRQIRVNDGAVLKRVQRVVSSESNLSDFFAELTLGLRDIGKATPEMDAKPFGLGTTERLLEPPPAPKRSAPTEVYVGYTLVGVGSVAVITGAVFAGLAIDAHNQYQDTSQASPELRDLRSRGNTYSVAADTLLIGGGVALGTGITLLVLDAIKPKGPRLSITMGRGRTGFALGGEF